MSTPSEDLGRQLDEFRDRLRPFKADGHADPLQKLQDFLTETGGGLLLLTGPADAGKTTLLRVAVSDFAQRSNGLAGSSPTFTASVKTCRQIFLQLRTVKGASRSRSRDCHSVRVSGSVSTTALAPRTSTR